MGQSKELQFALDVARRAGDIALRHYLAGVQADMKSDNTPVTVADRQCEAFVRQAIGAAYSADAILGEEEGDSGRQAARKWIIDPIDGTYNYARRIPIWSLLLALEEEGEITLGVVHAPAMKETFWAQKGAGAFRNGERIHVSQVAKACNSLFLFGGPNRIAAGPLWQGLGKTIAATYRQRAFGDYLNFAYVFEGKADAALEVDVKPWDLAPMKIIAEEAGGKYSDLAGGTSIYKGSCLVSNSLIHEEILQLLAS